MLSRLFFWCYVVQAILVQQYSCIFKITNIDCKSEDTNFSRFQLCRLKPVRRHVSALSLHINLLQVPVDDAVAHIQMFRRVNGYLPFLINGTWDLCDFMDKRKRISYLNVIYNLVKDYTNVNHSCPYNHDLILDKFVPLHSNMPLPWPTGEYLVKTVVYSGNKIRVVINLKFEFTEENIFVPKLNLN